MLSRVYGTKNLRVIDVSILPMPITAHTMPAACECADSCTWNPAHDPIQTPSRRRAPTSSWAKIPLSTGDRPGSAIDTEDIAHGPGYIYITTVIICLYTEEDWLLVQIRIAFLAFSMIMDGVR